MICRTSSSLSKLDTASSNSASTTSSLTSGSGASGSTSGSGASGSTPGSGASDLLSLLSFSINSALSTISLILFKYLSSPIAMDVSVDLLLTSDFLASSSDLSLELKSFFASLILLSASLLSHHIFQNQFCLCLYLFFIFQLSSLFLLKRTHKICNNFIAVFLSDFLFSFFNDNNPLNHSLNDLKSSSPSFF